MFAKIFLLISLLGLKNTIYGEPIESSVNDFEQLECQLICETCVMNVRGIRWLLLQSYTRKIAAELLSVMCNFFPYKQPRAQCKRFFKGPFDGIVHDFVVNMSVYEPCQYLGLCETVQQESMTSLDDSFFNKLWSNGLVLIVYTTFDNEVDVQSTTNLLHFYQLSTIINLHTNSIAVGQVHTPKTW
ncbi:unnamed protein product [Schistosoma margrebowiei]|uniref:Saposin B-type domain-containing protein n=1 Tax=Schistosoma margrebowiei TaxID=48269 RepID=A0AA84ZUE1_9TREM|nr:unnamed protein product [Schistosoma margrebowiei]